LEINQIKNIIINRSESMKSILNVKAGQLLWANVLSVKGNDLSLKIGSHVIEAKAQAYVKEGQLLRLLIEGVKTQEIRLKIVNEDSSVLKPEQSIAKAMGIKTNEIIEEVIKQMVRLRLPLSRETVLEFTKLQGNIIQKMNLKPSRLIQLAAWLRSVNIESDLENLLKLNNFFKGQLDKKEETLFFQFLNTRETLVLGNYNIYGWPILENHIYLMTQNHKKAKISPEQCFLVVKITSKAVGDLWFKMDYKNLFLKVSISCASDISEEIVISEIETLKTALIGAGYPDLKLSTKVEVLDSILDFIPGPDPEDINYVNLQV